MKNPERVAALIAELRTLAETDFERHRIDVLECDLHEPPTVEVVDDTHQRFNGVTYHKDKGGHYRLSTNVHRDVWTYYNGEIPENHQIHHVDGNPANNNIENLQCLSTSEHRRIHGGKTLKGKPMPDVEKICKHCGKVFVGKHVSEYCSKKCCYAAWRARRCAESVCEVCGRTYLRFDYNRGNVCSAQCAGRKARQAYMLKHSNNQ